MRDAKDSTVQNSLMLRAIGIGVLVFLPALAIHVSLDTGKQLGPFATGITDAPTAILWFVLSWGGWPLALAVIASSFYFRRMNLCEVAATCGAICTVGAFVAAAIESGQRATAVASGLAFYVPFYAAIGVGIGLVAFLASRVARRINQ